MDLPDEIFISKAQAKSKKCAEFLKEHRKNIDYESLQRDRNQKCQNRISTSNQYIGLLDPEDLTIYEDENNEITCLTPADLLRIKKTKQYINPYTGRRIPPSKIQNSLSQVSRAPYFDLYTSLQQLGENTMCPSYQSKNLYIGYTILPHKEPPYTRETLDDNIPVSLQVSPIENYGDIYRIITAKKLDYDESEIISKKNIKQIERVYNASSDSSEKIHPDREKIELNSHYVLKFNDLFFNGKNSFTNEDWIALDNAKIKEQRKLTLFQGVNFNEIFGNDDYIVGQSFEIEYDTLTEWTTNLCFSLNQAMKNSDGAVISALIPPEKILIDLRYIKNGNFPPVILVYPGRFKVELTTITNYNTPFTAKKTTLDTPDVIQETLVILQKIMK